MYTHKHAACTHSKYLTVGYPMHGRKGRQVSNVSADMSVARGGDVTGNTTVLIGRPQSRYLLLQVASYSSV